VFFSEVLLKEGTVLTIKKVNRGDLKVNIVNSTKLINRREQVITLNDIQVGHRISAKGVWDRDLRETR